MHIYETLPSGIKIVDYHPSFAASLAEFWNMCSQNEDDEWGGDTGISTASQVIAEHEMSSYYNVYLALDGEDVVGYCSFGRYFADANTLYVALLGARPDYRSKKIGKALVLRCVQRTIELGYPRLDLFTWSGNTAAVPLYKKCGFLWEDRPDGTHLANFMPTILTTPLFENFFKKADWYADSKRSLEITPDGVKVNGFELFGYSWEKDGEILQIGYERSGRQMRLIETNDYKIELMTQNHEVAFGTDYDCTFVIENKTGKKLDIKIAGREDGNIKLDYNLDMQITDKQEITAKFYVGAVDEQQDPWKVHPCLLADIEINGHAVTFGMGINTKFPLLVNFNRECLIDQAGMPIKTHIDIQSALFEDAVVTFNVPKNSILDIAGDFTVNIPAKGRVSIPTTATTLAIGAQNLELNCTAVLKSGSKLNINAPAFLLTRDMTQAFFQEDFEAYRIFNGPWKLEFSKKGDGSSISHLINTDYSNDDAFDAPMLGKPYDEEFNLIKPNVKTYQQNGGITIELEYVSGKFPGMVVTHVCTLFATGFITFVSRVENRADKPRHVMLQDCYGIKVGPHSVFSSSGKITKNHGSGLEGFSNVTSDSFDENWIFEDSPQATHGYCWPAEYKPLIEWGRILTFEIDPGELAPGQIFESKPVIYALGLFTNFNDLRNYARQIYNLNPVLPVNTMEVVLNGYNPFMADSKINLDVINNRDEVQEGTITVSSKNLPECLWQTNPHEARVERNSFEIPLNPANDISVVNIAMNMVGYENSCDKVAFFPKGKITTLQEGTAYSVSNGAITFKADTKYSHGCYSLTDAKGQEWLLSQYPEHKSYSWFNPFIGGIRIRIEDMDERTILKEKITADFADVRDNFGNLWQGICLTLTVTEDEKLKGAVYKTYHLTQPGLPVLCTFFQFKNGTGEYKDAITWMSTCLKPDEDGKNVIVEAIGKDRSKIRRRMGSLDTPEFFYEGTMAASSSRVEKIYGLCNSDKSEHLNDFWGNNKIPVMATFSFGKARAADGETFTSNPGFLVITDKDLPQGALGDLERIKFFD